MFFNEQHAPWVLMLAISPAAAAVVVVAVVVVVAAAVANLTESAEALLDSPASWSLCSLSLSAELFAAAVVERTPSDSPPPQQQPWLLSARWL